MQRAYRFKIPALRAFKPAIANFLHGKILVHCIGVDGVYLITIVVCTYFSVNGNTKTLQETTQELMGKKEVDVKWQDSYLPKTESTTDANDQASNEKGGHHDGETRVRLVDGHTSIDIKMIDLRPMDVIRYKIGGDEGRSYSRQLISSRLT